MIKWRRSSRSAAAGNCVEVAAAADSVVVRDSKDRAGSVLAFSVADWRGFVGQFWVHSRSA
jgi:hypothetical protein